MAKNIWGEEVLDSKDSNDPNSVLYKGDLFENFENLKDFSGLADAAEKLASNTIIMDFYSHFEKGTYGFFFSPNSKLKSATGRPFKFENWEDWTSLNSKRQSTLAVLGGFREDATDIIKNNNHLNRLKEAFIKWPENLYSVFWGNEFTGTYTCNIFVGDSIFLWQGKSIMASNQHYYSPSQIIRGLSPFNKLEKNIVERGAVVLFRSTHMEIVTSRERNRFFSDGFCSIGSGRGLRSATGTIKCDSIWLSTREIENKNNNFYTL